MLTNHRCANPARVSGGSARAVWAGVVEPVDEACHFRRHLRRWRGFEMDFDLAVCAGDDLHRIGMGAVATDISDIVARAHDQAVPVKQHRIVKRTIITAIKSGHHVGDALFGGRNAPVLAAKTEISAERRLQ